MTSVKPLYDQTLDLNDYEPKHLGLLLERAARRMRSDIARLPGSGQLRERHAPLTPSYFRLLAIVPSGGASLTELARPAGMSKQALGQFFDTMLSHGYVTLTRAAYDGRVRIVRRTEKGDGLVEEVNAMFAQLRDYHREVLGARRCDQLYSLLETFATGWSED